MAEYWPIAVIACFCCNIIIVLAWRGMQHGVSKASNSSGVQHVWVS